MSELNEEEIIKNYNRILNNAKANWIYEDYEILLNFFELYIKEKEKNKELNKIMNEMIKIDPYIYRTATIRLELLEERN